MTATELIPGRYLMTSPCGRMVVQVRYLGRRLVIIPPSGYPQEPATFGPEYRFEKLEA